jgi:hypothetical protein
MAITINGSGITSSEIASNTITSGNLADGTITNADINASAGIVGSKLSSLSVPYAANASDDAWHSTLTNDTNYTTLSPISFDSHQFLGSNISASGGAFTVTNSGLYLITCKISNSSTSNVTSVWRLKIVTSGGAGTTLLRTLLYWSSASEIAYLSATGTWPVKLNAGDSVRIEGTGFLRGSSDMTQFTGAKIGEL